MAGNLSITREGVWVGGPGASRLHTWKSLVLLALIPVLVAFSILIGLDRSFPILGYMATATTERHKETLWDFLTQANSVALRQALSSSQLTAESKIPTVALMIEDDALPRLVRARKAGNPNLGREPGGDRPYFSAAYIDENGFPQKAKASSRGYGLQHFSAHKPSLRLKIRKADIRSGFRFVELSRPEDALDFLNWWPESIAQEMGLLTSMRHHVRLFLNYRYKGLYIRSYRAGESLGLAQGRLPGTWFKGDLFNTKGRYGSLWETIDAWRLAGEQDPHALGFFTDFLALINSKPETIDRPLLERFWSFLDFESSAAAAAINTLVGSTHTDETHNHVYYLSPYKGKLESTVWDPNGFIMNPPDTPPNTLVHAIMRFQYADAEWVHRRDQLLWQLINGAGSPTAMEKELSRLSELVANDLLCDPNIGELQYTPIGVIFSPLHHSDLESSFQRQKDWIAQRGAFLRNYLEDAGVDVQQQDSGLRVLVTGRVAVRAVAEDGSEQLLYSGLSAKQERMVLDRNGAPAVMGQFPSVPMGYVLPLGNYRFLNAVTGQPASTKKPGPPARPLTVVPAPKPNPKPIVLGPGKFTLTETLVTQKDQLLEVRAGTELKLETGVSLIAQGPLKFAGTAQDPITLMGDNWGCLGAANIKGPVELSHVQVQGGGEVRHGGLHFKGMVSFYNCSQVSLNNCNFGPNSSGDDAVNIAHSEVSINDCTWRGAAFDGLDLDACGASIERTRWIDCGNDGLDISCSQVVLKDSGFEGCGDKGLSVGEASDLLAQETLFQGNQIGVQGKDSSRAFLERCDFRDNKLALSGYRKKWLFSQGGQLLTLDCQFSGNSQEELMEEKSSRSDQTDPAWDDLKAQLLSWSSGGFPSTKRNLLR